MTTLGMVGLGRMGGNMTRRLRDRGIEVVAYDRDPGLAEVADLAALVDALPSPRLVWLMLPAGAPTDDTIDQLVDHLDDGDTIVDGGNANWRTTVARAERLREHGLELVDAGVSGGVWGYDEGYALMVGGTDAAVARLQPVFDALRPEEGGFSHAGPVGAGHYAKMIHNGIEYGMMQAFAEGIELLEAGGPGDVDVTEVVRGWQHGSVVRSWLLDLLVRALEDEESFAAIRGWAEDSGEGRWTVEEAIATATPAPVITAALYARFASRQDDPLAMRVIAALRQQFGGHAVRS
ncbi:phosphogluconate dehydrogenase (NAD(+)-dependent, decarboxylating) [Egicoccus halophilus]|uniref:6-phosphogluconate dehydrogenase n=1 Tax=Egicoccus halophilus TaxID=1670830 RepID=A0A8J3AEJ1_9ACTN|nr:decarboxylating 6-phosphogluconate dehydrogenase [Egicoccus halophilus]GGI07055.1 6-phosphogluconate dehydrogenase [Egicoccus halophilus]